MGYTILTVRDIVDAVNGDKTNFPKGLDTPVVTGDFEGNYTHKMHEIQTYDGKLVGKAICLGYEMHEGSVYKEG